MYDGTLLAVHRSFTQHTTENSLPDEIRNPKGEFLKVYFGIPNTLPNYAFFLAGCIPVLNTFIEYLY